MRRDPGLANSYQEQLQELILTGKAIKIEKSDTTAEVNTWYLPHHPVVRMDKTTTKVRIVFDGSAKGFEGVSLLLPGPPLQPDLLAVLIRFRRHKVALAADIEKMFLQINLNREDRNFQRFLWRDMETDREPDEYCLTTVTFGLKCSPFLSIKTIFEHVEKEKESFPTASAEIKKNIFVDDILTGVETEENAADLSVQMKELLSRGGFTLRKFVSNKSNSLKRLKEQDLAAHHIVKMATNDSTTSALGVKFLPTEDVLMFSFYEKLDNVETETRRTFLKQLHRIYDPMGLLAPFTPKAKQLFQRAWTTTCDWDQPLPTELVQEWQKWKLEVSVLDQIKVSRCFAPEEFQNPTYTLHVFGDSCEAAYGAVVYLRVGDSVTPRVNVANVCSKTRVAPLKNRRSLPELELTASLLAARLVQYVRREIDLPVDDIYCWTDSRVALEWISQPLHVWQTYVANRVSEIQSLIEPSKWKHIPGKSNPADLCSRGSWANVLVHSKLWWNGPEFLQLKEECWPKQERNSRKTVIETANTKKKTKTALVGTLSVNKNEDCLEQYISKFSSYNRFINVLVRVRSWANRHKTRSKDSEVSETHETLSLDSRQNEETFWVKWAQMNAYQDEIEALKAGKLLPKGSPLVPLDPFWDQDEQLLRVGGRLQNTLLPGETKILLFYPHTTI